MWGQPNHCTATDDVPHRTRTALSRAALAFALATLALLLGGCDRPLPPPWDEDDPTRGALEIHQRCGRETTELRMRYGRFEMAVPCKYLASSPSRRRDQDYAIGLQYYYVNDDEGPRLLHKTCHLTGECPEDSAHLPVHVWTFPSSYPRPPMRNHERLPPSQISDLGDFKFYHLRPRSISYLVALRNQRDAMGREVDFSCQFSRGGTPVLAPGEVFELQREDYTAGARCLSHWYARHDLVIGLQAPPWLVGEFPAIAALVQAEVVSYLIKE
jgi:hypothetical protein